MIMIFRKRGAYGGHKSISGGGRRRATGGGTSRRAAPFAIPYN
jgi:hypothetical protein